MTHKESSEHVVKPKCDWGNHMGVGRGGSVEENKVVSYGSGPVWEEGR